MSLNTRISRLDASPWLPAWLVCWPPGWHAGRKPRGIVPLESDGRNFTVVSISGNTAPTTMMVQRDTDTPEIMVEINPTTILVRRFNGPADLSRFSAGDQVHVTGTGTAATTIVAAEVQDNSIQIAYTQINGRVLFVSRALDRMVLRVTANQGGNAAIPVGNIATLDIMPTTPVDLIGQHNATVANDGPAWCSPCGGSAIVRAKSCSARTT